MLFYFGTLAHRVLATVSDTYGEDGLYLADVKFKREDLGLLTNRNRHCLVFH